MSMYDPGFAQRRFRTAAVVFVRDALACMEQRHDLYNPERVEQIAWEVSAWFEATYGLPGNALQADFTGTVLPRPLRR